MDPELSAPARIVWSVALGMAVVAVASLAAIGFVDLVQGISGLLRGAIRLQSGALATTDTRRGADRSVPAPLHAAASALRPRGLRGPPCRSPLPCPPARRQPAESHVAFQTAGSPREVDQFEGRRNPWQTPRAWGRPHAHWPTGRIDDGRVRRGGGDHQLALAHERLECRGFGSRRPCPPCRHSRAHGDGRQAYDSRAPGSMSGQGAPASLPAVR